ncbi:MAG: GerMN domain-containing protein [Firmicutes bacterium]|nr:GerMN domain-containing protein [Bacillota bacterium]
MSKFKQQFAIIFCMVLLGSFAGCSRENSITEVNANTQPEQDIFHGLTASEVKAQLENAPCFIDFMGENIPYWRPNWTGFTDDDSIQIDSSDAIISVSTHWGNFSASLSYRVQGGTICWNINAYKPLWRELRLWEAPVPRHLTDLEYVTIGFAYYCPELDPNVELLPEALMHHWEEISGKNLWVEFIRLMRCHTGIRIRDLWYDGTRLYVDLAPVEAIVFNWGSTGSAQRQSSLINTLSTFPNVTEIVILIDGEADVAADHFNFEGVIRV